MKNYKYTYFGVSTTLYAQSKENEKEVQQQLNNTLDEYEAMIETKQKFVVEFERIDKAGRLDMVTENGIIITMTLEDISKDTDSLTRTKALSRIYEVQVTKVDRKKNTVYVSYLEARQQQRSHILSRINYLLKQQRECKDEAEKVAREKLNEQIHNELSNVVSGMAAKTRAHWENAKLHEGVVKEMNANKNKWIVVPSVVKYVDRDKAYVDILGYNIMGVLHKRYYAYTHINTLASLVKTGDIIDVAIIGTEQNEGQTGHSSKIYVCARTPIIENPWDNLMFNEGDKVKVTCTHIGTDYNAGWFGTIGGYSDIEIRCQMPEKSFGVDIVLGHKYNCTIYKVNKDTRVIMARTYSEVVNRRR